MERRRAQAEEATGDRALATVASGSPAFMNGFPAFVDPYRAGLFAQPAIPLLAGEISWVFRKLEP